ncbi:GpE family phage tail protein [Yersinia pseudotuberculosis]|uniref:GpE family phage tail protein n=1 Tax=Yersinia pseudotuberculosis TaxID=633 RepID=UPI0003D5D392|nr:GpE family phage tail protein [Yersinia pseudotuberculosis]GAE12376.1 hypothetical protein YP1_065_00420 [Yersinia pseudotuberculosis NBRC 105692]VEG87763.1 tail protein [Yersinia pseudotuberculosis]
MSKITTVDALPSVPVETSADAFNVVTLDAPIMRGNTTITQITVNKPNTGALRGAKLQALLDTDVDALIRVLPRVTTPNLTVPEINNLEPADIYALSQALALFFLTELGAVRFPDSLTVDDLIADIAITFHWPPSATEEMSLGELLEWRHKAIIRNGGSDE